jgi:hypothetical protein
VTSDATDSDAAGIDSGKRSDVCRTERSQLRSRKRALREQATPVWRAGQDMTRAVGLATGRVTTCHGVTTCRPAQCQSRPAQGHGGHGIHGTGHSDHGDGERPAGPESTAASAAGAAAFTIPF